MHRHSYSGRKLQRERDQRRALMKGLATSLIEEESIETTLPKAKEIVPYVEKLITKAKKGGLHQQRLVGSKLSSSDATAKLFDRVAVATKNRSSGHLRIERTKLRRGDNAQLARVSFVDDLAKSTLKAEKKPKKASNSTEKISKTEAKATGKKEEK